jgi:putative cardiolipin synthase
MREKKVKVNLYTNSLGSTDAVYVAANFYGIVYSWQAAGLVPYIHDSKYHAIDPVLNEVVEATRWGMHEKTQIYSDDSFYVGTYNIDNRSDFYNVEMGIVCEGSKELTADLMASVKDRASRAYVITGKNKAVNPKGEPADVYGGASQSLIKIMKRFSPVFKWLEPLM